MPSPNKKVYIQFLKIPYVKNVVHVHHVNTQNRFNIFIINVCHQYEGRSMQPLYKKV
jgi:hypothetical protein